MNTILTSIDFWRYRLRASATHLGISLHIAAVAALLVEPELLNRAPADHSKDFWTVFVDPVTANVVATMPLDSF